MSQATLTRSLSGALAERYLDWEDWLTFALALGAMLGVTVSLEDAGWSSEMPSLTLVGVLALLFAFGLARTSVHGLAAWALMALTGAAVTLWQTYVMVGPGGPEARLDAIHFRFQRWFDLAFSGGISNDSLPFNVIVVGVTWLGVFAFGWAVYRWHNGWLGLIPGGLALFLNLAFINDAIPFAVFMFVLCGFLLVMRTNLMAGIQRWRAEGVDYPPLISLSFLHYTFWAGLLLLAAAWIAPTGPFPTPGLVDSLTQRFESITVHFVRLAGPLRVNKIVPVHDYTAVLPFQGSIELRERELLAVRVDDPTIGGSLLLRGAVYDQYASGGWKAGARQEIEFSDAFAGDATADAADGRVVPITVTVEAKSVVGTVLFTPGRPLSATVPGEARVSSGSITEIPAVSDGWPRLLFPDDGNVAGLSDEEVLASVPSGWQGLYVRRGDDDAVEAVGAVRQSELPDVAVLAPEERIEEGESYSIVGLVSDIEPDQLRRSGATYPQWVRNTYLSLPDDVPQRVRDLAGEVAGGLTTSNYDRVKAVETYLRDFPVGFDVGDTPPGRDTVDYFLFESREGYFDYHASAMVVLLRALEIPSRLAVGFVVDTESLDAKNGAQVVRDKNAYAWVEVYFPGQGWVEFNPSPDRPAELGPRELELGVDLPPQGLSDIPDIPVSIGPVFPITDDPTAGGSGGSGASGFSPGPALWIALGAFGVLAGVAVTGALSWRRSLAGLPQSQQMWEKTVRLASWAGHPPAPGQTPVAFARDLARRHRDVPHIDDLAGAYSRSRFGHKDSDPEEAGRLERVWRNLRGPLIGEVLRRPWRRS
ncbi:MAG: transglutaminase domain-containing protein [Dehalococcoidia bacterium]